MKSKKLRSEERKIAHRENMKNEGLPGKFFLREIEDRTSWR